MFKTDQLNRRQAPFFIKGPVGQLEVSVDTPPEIGEKEIAIICHPDPQQGGTMHNKVVTTVSRAFQTLGAVAVRFNYRGVQNSEGEFGHVTGEIEDALMILEWVREQFKGYRISLAGFSFGSYIAASLALKNQAIKQLITVAPAVTRMNFSGFNEIVCPWLLVQGGEDEVVPSESVLKWHQSMKKPMDLIVLPNASHFFHGQLILLKEKLVEYLEAKRELL